MDSSPPLAIDLLRGAEEIAEYAYGDKRFVRRVYHLAETKRIPVFKLGILLCARKSRLLSWIEEQESANLAGNAAA